MVEMRMCTRCKSEHVIGEFITLHRGKYLGHWCKNCRSVYSKNWANTHREICRKLQNRWAKSDKGRKFRAEYQKNKLANDDEYKKKQTAAVAAKDKLKKRSICEICLSTDKIQGHHEDYNKPLDVIYLCQACHYYLHKQYREQGIKI